MGGLYTEAEPEKLPLGASPRVINDDFILGSVLPRPGKLNPFTYPSSQFTVTETANFTQSIGDGVAWNGGSVTLNTPSGVTPGIISFDRIVTNTGAFSPLTVGPVTAAGSNELAFLFWSAGIEYLAPGGNYISDISAGWSSNTVANQNNGVGPVFPGDPPWAPWDNSGTGLSTQSYFFWRIANGIISAQSNAVLSPGYWGSWLAAIVLLRYSGSGFPTDFSSNNVPVSTFHVETLGGPGTYTGWGLGFSITPGFLLGCATRFGPAAGTGDVTFSDPVGNVYNIIANLTVSQPGSVGTVNDGSSRMLIFYCDNFNGSAGATTITANYDPGTGDGSANPWDFLGVVYNTAVTGPPTPGASQTLQGLNFPFTLPTEITYPPGEGPPFITEGCGDTFEVTTASTTQLPILGVQVLVTGSQTDLAADSIITVQLQLPDGTLSPTSITGQLPLTSGTVTIGSSMELWGLTITPALLDDPNFKANVVASASGLVTFTITSIALKVWTTGNSASGFLPANFNYLKTFEETGGEILNLALGSDGVMYQEDAVNNPGTLVPVYSAIEPDSYAQSVTVDNREFIAISNLHNGTDIPLTYTPPNFDRLSQVGPGAPPSGSTTNSGQLVVTSITQNPIVNIPTSTGGTNGSFIVWSDSPQDNGSFGHPATPGNVMTWVFPRAFTLPSYIQVGSNIVISGVQSMPSGGSNYDPNNGVGANPAYYTVTSIGAPITGQDYYNAFTITLPQTGFYNQRFQAGSAFQATVATMTTAAQVPNLEVGGTFEIAGTGGAPPAGYDGTWTVLTSPNATQVQITATSLTANIATYSYTAPIGATPAVGQAITVQGTLNGNGIFNVTGAIITATNPGSFMVSLTGPNVPSAAEVNSSGIIFGTVFTFDPLTIVGNKTGGTIVTTGVIGVGRRGVCYSFLTRNGFVSKPSPINYFDVTVGAQKISIANIAIGPPNVIARILHFTAANGGNFYNIPDPVIVISNGVQVINDSTWIEDNVTTGITLSFADGVLLAADEIDIQGNNLFECFELGSCTMLVPYALRLFAIGEQNKIMNLLNYSFDGGIGVVGAGGGTPSTYPLGWVVDPASGAGGAVVTSPIFGWAYQITGSGSLITGMITQNAFQDEFMAPIVAASTTYSVRVTCMVNPVPVGGSLDSLVIDLFSPNFNTAFGTFTLPLDGVTASMQIYTGTLLLNEFAPVPNDLKIRVYAMNLSAGTVILIDRFEPFPTEEPNLDTQIIGSYAQAYEQFDRLSGIVLATQQNQQPVKSAFVLYGTLNMVKTGSMVAVNDNNTTEPADWTIPRVVSQTVGTEGPYGVSTGIDEANTGEEWALIAGRPGVFLYQGQQPVKLSEEIQSLWDFINWRYGYTIWIKNDILNRRLMVGVPMKTYGTYRNIPQQNPWIPSGIMGDFPNPTTPTVILMMNYKQLNTGSQVESDVVIHRSRTGNMAASDIVRKWAIWTIKAPAAAFLEQADGTAPIFVGNSDHVGKIYELVDGLFEDDGMPFWQDYMTAGFTPSEAGEGAQVGVVRYTFEYMPVMIKGLGVVFVKVYPNSLDTPYSHFLLPNLLLPASTNGDVEYPVNEVGNRLFVEFRCSCVGTGFILSRIVMSMRQEAWAPVTGRNI